MKCMQLFIPKGEKKRDIVKALTSELENLLDTVTNKQIVQEVSTNILEALKVVSVQDNVVQEGFSLNIIEGSVIQSTYTGDKKLYWVSDKFLPFDFSKAKEIK